MAAAVAVEPLLLLAFEAKAAHIEAKRDGLSAKTARRLIKIPQRMQRGKIKLIFHTDWYYFNCYFI